MFTGTAVFDLLLPGDSRSLKAKRGYVRPIVAALRETSVLFGAAIAVVLLKEPLRPSRIGAALLIVAGLVLIRLS